MAFVRTVTGDIPPDEVGITLPHEHLLTEAPAVAADDDLTLDSEAVAVAELGYFKVSGGGTVVEMTPIDYGRQPAALKRVSEASGVNVVCVTGYLKDKFCRPHVENQTVEQIAERMIRDVNDGIDDTGVRAGVIKASSSKNTVTDAEAKVFKAAAVAHREMGAPISTHTEAGTMGLEQVAMLTEGGVPPEKIIIGHCDRNMDWDYHIALAQTGVFLGYDQLAKEKYYPDALRVEYVLRMVEAGYGGQILLSLDIARKSYFPGYGGFGGPGFTYLTWRFVPWLVSEGLDAAVARDIITKNPARALTFAG